MRVHQGGARTTRSNGRRIGLGAMELSEPPRDDRTGAALLHRAVDLGIEILDTADRYGAGHNEDLIGRTLGRRRSEVVICTKIGFVGRPGDARAVDNRPEYLRRACEASLDRLRTDHVDLLLLHRVDPTVAFEDSLGALAELQESGKTRAIGLSEVGPDTLRSAHAIHPLDAVQIEYSIASRDPGDALLGVCRQLDVQLHASSPLGIGLLAAPLAALHDDGAHLHRRLRTTPRAQPAALAANAARIQRLTELADSAGCTVAQLALAWLLHRGSNVVALPGTRRVAHLEANLAARDLDLDDELLVRLDRDFPIGAFAGARKGERQMSLTLP